MSEDTIPEIQRCHLSSIVLQLLALGVSDVLSFDFMSPPPHDSLVAAIEQLYLLGAVEKRNTGTPKHPPTKKRHRGHKVGSQDAQEAETEPEEDYNLQLTPLGEKLAHFPLDPRLARAILSSAELGCTHEVLTVVAMLSVDSVVFSPREKREQVAAVHRKFVSADGDHMTLLSIYRAYNSARGNKVGLFLCVNCLWFIMWYMYMQSWFY